MSSLALLAAGNGRVAAAVQGGHGELFVQEFDESTNPTSELGNLPPAEAARVIAAEIVVGSGAAQLVAARGWGEARDAWPSAANALALPEALRSLPPRPVYARAPDARVREAA
jgi:tRNA A37 threonylcarbamoyladenosine modification protein TsaB